MPEKSPMKNVLDAYSAHNFVEVKMEPDDYIVPRSRRNSRKKSPIPVAKRTRRQTQNSTQETPRKIEKSKTRQKSPSDSESSTSFDSDVEKVPENCKCNICEETFCSQEIRDYHWRYDHLPTSFPDGPEKPGFFECNQCDMKFAKRFQFARHLVAHRDNDIDALQPRVLQRCGICRKRFYTEMSYQRHMDEAISEHEPVECDICKKTFPSKRNLVAHVRKHMEPMICHICGSTKSDVASMRMHIRRHNKDYNVFCEICNKPFYNKAELRMHMFHAHTNRETNRPFVCQFCGRTYRSPGYLKLHVKNVHVDADEYKRIKYKCDLCDFTTHLLKCLKIHKQTHTGENLIPCQICDKMINKRYMPYHIRLHSGDKPFHCAICDRHYTSKKNLVRHQNRNHKVVA